MKHKKQIHIVRGNAQGDCSKDEPRSLSINSSLQRPDIRFKCASKPWRSLISKPNFAKAHLNHERENGKQETERLFSISGYRNCYSLGFKSLNSKAIRMRFRHQRMNLEFTMIWNSCDGLLLLTSLCFNLFIVNPSTGECRMVPESPFSIDSESAMDYYGLGYDSSIDHYKVVKISHDSFRLYEDVVSVYNLKTSSWRRIESSPKSSSWFTTGPFVNKALHCLCEDEIISFNMEREDFQSIPFPYSAGETIILGTLDATGGCLCGFDDDFDFKYAFDFWVMKEYGVRDSWTRFKIDHPPLTWALPSISGELVLCKGKRILLYDKQTGRAYKLAARRFVDGDMERTTYEESLIRLQEQDEYGEQN